MKGGGRPRHSLRFLLICFVLSVEASLCVADAIESVLIEKNEESDEIRITQTSPLKLSSPLSSSSRLSAEISGSSVLSRVASSPAADGSSSSCRGGVAGAVTRKQDPTIASDHLGFESIRFLHSQLDDDENGRVDVAESNGFLQDELKYEKNSERNRRFHAHDQHITVIELWESWTRSEVHNWTVDSVVQWLAENVELPQYVPLFLEHNVSGEDLPKLATNQMQFLTGVLNIKDPIHKQKIALKSMDVVLFGAPKHGHHLIKDIALLTSLVVAVAGCWFALAQKKSSQKHLQKMLHDLEGLNKAEQALGELQEKLEEAHRQQMNAVEEKKKVEEKLMDEIKEAKNEAKRLQETRHNTEEEISRLRHAEEELNHVRSALRTELENRKWTAPPLLQEWLQLTHEVELKHYNNRKLAAEVQLSNAKDACEKLRRKRGTFMGSFRVAHGYTIDEVDASIIAARQSLDNVTRDLKERLHRWQQIECTCTFSIQQNVGLERLERLLRAASVSPTTTSDIHRSSGTFPLLKELGQQSSLHSSASTQSLNSLEARRETFQRKDSRDSSSSNQSNSASTDFVGQDTMPSTNFNNSKILPATDHNHKMQNSSS